MTDLIRFHLRWRDEPGIPLTDAHAGYHQAEREPWTACRACLRTWRGHEDRAHRCVPPPPEPKPPPRPRRPNWTEEEDTVLLLHTDRAASIILGRTELACYKRRYRIIAADYATAIKENSYA